MINYLTHFREVHGGGRVLLLYFLSLSLRIYLQVFYSFVLLKVSSCSRGIKMEKKQSPQKAILKIIPCPCGANR